MSQNLSVSGPSCPSYLTRSSYEPPALSLASSSRSSNIENITELYLRMSSIVVSLSASSSAILSEREGCLAVTGGTAAKAGITGAGYPPACGRPNGLYGFAPGCGIPGQYPAGLKYG